MQFLTEKTRTSVFCIGVVLALLPLCVGGDFVLRIAHTSDVHSRFEPTDTNGNICDDGEECFGGVARRFAEVQRLRNAGGQNLLFMDSGDQFSGTLWFYLYKGNATAHFMNILGYDVMSIGNHEIEEGTAVLRRFLETVNFPVISSTIDASNDANIEGLFTPSVIKTVAGENIGIVGYTSEESATRAHPLAVQNLTFGNVSDHVQAEVDRLRAQGINKIIALGHNGLPHDKDMAVAVEGIDVVVGGRSDSFLYTGDPPSVEEPEGPYPIVITQESGAEVLIVHPFAFGKYLGYLEVTFDDDGNVISYEGNPILLNESYPEDPTVKAEVETWKERVTNFTQKTFGHSAVFLNGDRHSCRFKECNMGNLITDVLVYHFTRLSPTVPGKWTDVGIAMWNSGAIRASIEEGPITITDVLTAFPYGDAIERIRVTGQTLLEALQRSAEVMVPGRKRGAHGGFMQMSGVRAVYDVGTKPTSLVEDSVEVICTECLEPAFEPLDLEKTYEIITTQFITEGGDGYTMFKENRLSKFTYEEVESDILIDYITWRSPILAKLDGRIMFVNSSATPVVNETTPAPLECAAPRHALNSAVLLLLGVAALLALTQFETS